MKKKPVIYRDIFKDIFGVEHLQDPIKLPGADVRQIDNSHYIQPAYMLSIPAGKYDDGSERKEQYVMQGAESIISDTWGIVLTGFVEQCDHVITLRKDAEGMGVFRREKWIVPFAAVR